MIPSLLELFNRDLSRVRSELESYSHEKLMWETTDGITNSAGNLTLHVCGNLQHFVGSVLGESGYVRQREKEFSARNIPIQELKNELIATQEAIMETMKNLDASVLSQTYPINVFGEEMTTEWFLLHLSGHLNYHLGQINYHRRIIDPKSTE